MSQQVDDSAEITDDAVVSDEMAKYGISKILVAQYHCGEYRYSNLRDAVAHAKRTVDALGKADSSGSK